MLLENGGVCYDSSSIETIGFYLNGLGKSKDIIDLSVMPRAGIKHHAFTLLAMELLNTNEGGTLNEKQPLDILIKFSLTESIENLIVGFALSNPTAGNLVECRSTASFPSLTLNQGVFTMKVSSQLSLKSGSYVLNLGARSSKGHLEYIPSISIINITPDRTQDLSEWSNPSAGMLITPSTWELIK
ncbi:MAG: Wzt carbohydrate-binding domain-containing protein [Bacteroidetes bacterium]|nr:Wzt carbohydrate-binding domain-containing protein [Bacteroidota bacterium]